MSIKHHITAEDIQAARIEKGVRLFEASSYLKKQQMVLLLEEAETMDEMKYILFSIKNTTFK